MQKILDVSSSNTKGHRARLKERLMKTKLGDLEDYEILELFLFNVFKRHDTKPLAKQLLNKFGNLSFVINASPQELRSIKWMNSSTIAMFRTFNELISRVHYDKLLECSIINNWEALIDYLKHSIGYRSNEHLIVLFLNQRYMVIDRCVQDVGTIDQTPLYIREVIKLALDVSAYYIILGHNHPSGDVTPSAQDIKVTKRLSNTCSSIGLNLIDHVILSGESYFSFKSHGII